MQRKDERDYINQPRGKNGNRTIPIRRRKAILKEALTTELTIRDLCRKHGITDASFYTWRMIYQPAISEKFGGTGMLRQKHVRNVRRKARIKHPPKAVLTNQELMEIQLEAISFENLKLRNDLTMA